ncbi:MAG: sel1 repeat family protein [Gammaproteobacteria bacterium]|nr:sel1 repeat family protein [Gammaproteobacteria bacterium]
MTHGRRPLAVVAAVKPQRGGVPQRPAPAAGGARPDPRRLRLLCLGLACVIAFGCGRRTDPEAAFRRGDYETAFSLWQPRAAAGDPVAQNYLGIHYQLGLGVDRDATAAARWYRRAAVAGNADAQRNLGTLYQLGLGLPKDNQRAYGWYHFAADQGNRVAQAYIVAMTGVLTPNQIVQAREMIRLELQARAPAAARGGAQAGAAPVATGSRARD